MATLEHKCVNLGDVNYIAYGGCFVHYEEIQYSAWETKQLAKGRLPEGYHLPEPMDPYMEVLEPPPDDAEEGKEEWTVYVIDLEQFKIVERDRTIYLVSKGWDESWPYALSAYDEWFHKDLEDVASCMDTTARELRQAFASDDVLQRAWAYQSLGSYLGFGCNYPQARYTQHEIHERYNQLEDCECAECCPPEED